MGNGTCLGEKAFNFMTCHLLMEHFNSSLGVQMNMHPQVDVSKVPLPEKLDETIVAQLLPHAVSQSHTSSWEYTDKRAREPTQYESDRQTEGYSQGTLIFSSECYRTHYTLMETEIQLCELLHEVN